MRRRVERLAVLLLIVWLAGCAPVPMDGQSDLGDEKFRVFGTETVGQKFMSSDRNFSRVDVFLAPSLALQDKPLFSERRLALKGLAGKNVHIEVYSERDKKRVARAMLPVKKIRQATMYAFPFAPQADSKLQRYSVVVRAPKLREDQAVSARLTIFDRYAKGHALINGRPAKKTDMRFLPFISMTPRMLLNSMASRLLADIGFLLFWVAAVLAALALTVAAWWRAE